jgi:hypothetical protein
VSRSEGDRRIRLFYQLLAAVEGLNLNVQCMLKPWGFIGLICLASCSRRVDPVDVVARVGEHGLTRSMVAALAGKPYDSLAASERWLVVERWADERLFELEGERRGFADNAEMQERVAALRGALYRSQIMQTEALPAPADSAIALYYQTHRAEFLRTKDSYLIEMYWGQAQAVVAEFRNELMRGDTTKLGTREIVAEGKWLAEDAELDAEIAREISGLKSGQCTQVRPAEDGFRVLRLIESYPAGSVLDLTVVRAEIVERMLIAASYAREDSLRAQFKERWPVEVLLDAEK